MGGLKSRGISGAKCLRCCERQRDLTNINLRQFLGDLLQRALDARDSDREDLVLAFKIPTGPIVFPPRPIKVILAPRGSPLLIGAIVFLAGLALSTLLAKLATISVLSGLIEHLELLLPDDCDSCIKRGLWGQTKKRVSGVFFARKLQVTKNPRRREYRRFPLRGKPSPPLPRKKNRRKI